MGKRAHRRADVAGDILLCMDPHWAESVRAALLAGEPDALAALFDQALAEEGRAEASRSWLAAISAFDADAVTG